MESYYSWYFPNVLLLCSYLRSGVVRVCSIMKKFMLLFGGNLSEINNFKRESSLQAKKWQREFSYIAHAIWDPYFGSYGNKQKLRWYQKDLIKDWTLFTLTDRGAATLENVARKALQLIGGSCEHASRTHIRKRRRKGKSSSPWVRVELIAVLIRLSIVSVSN